MSLSAYVLLVQHIEGIIDSPLDNGLKIRSIETLIRSVRDDEREGEPDDDRR